eukprot:c41313_g1_i1 orf=3-230(-)
MQKECVKPNNVTFLSVLNACATLEDLALGKLVHAQIIESGFESIVVVGNSLVSMYHKCGSMDSAESVFHKIPKRDV